MGLVKKGGDEAGKGEGAAEEEEKPEDPPIVKRLKEVDDRFLELEREYEREAHKLQLKYAEKQKPLLEERRRILVEVEEAPSSAEAATGTPALGGFWLQALNNSPAGDCIMEWDEPVLEYLQDIERVLLEAKDDGPDTSKHFKLVFTFAENPYFTNSKLEKEYSVGVANPYCGMAEMKEIKASSIDWKAGKDVTVEVVAKKVKGGGAKKAKSKKGKEEPRPSFFRDFFRNLSPGKELPEDAKEMAAMMLEHEGEDIDDLEDDDLVSMLMDQDYEVGSTIRDHIVPWAVRWYTGEARPDDDDDDDDDEDDDDDDDDDSDEEDEEDSDDEPPQPKGRRGGGGGGGGGGGRGGAGKPGGGGKHKGGGKGAGKAEECKQQ